MSDVPDDEANVSDSTRAAEAEDEQQHAGADRPPTPEEEAAAEARPRVDPEAAASYKKAAETGAHIAGEGQIS